MDRALALAAAVVSLSLAGAARADQSPREGEGRRAEAKAIASRGDTEFYAGRCDRAIPLWREAEAAYHAPTILLRVARCQALMGHVVEASATLDRVAGEALRPDAPPAFYMAQEQAKRELAGVRARIATLHVVAHPRRGDSVPLVVEIDGVAQREGVTTFPVDPGEHAVRVRAGASSWQTTVKLKDGESLTCDVALWTEREPKRPQVQRAIGLAAFGAGGASVAVGVGFSIAALATSHHLDAVCGAGRVHCPPDAQGDIDRVRVFSSVADGTIGGGAALIVAGAITLVTAPRPDGDAWRVRFAAAPTSFSLRADF